MAYKVLYRKYRPNTFNEIVGQSNIVENLKNSIINENFSHAYIFTGPRGTGKTSTAKVLAKAINCTNFKNGEICGECDSCKNFATSPDIIEIDAASNNGVDEIRELRNNITLAPAASKFKIYIIDEVHMLSPGAFNALLKTLEEPPAHAIFILATTEVYKVPITILSRCQRYDFKKIEKQDMVNYLKEICEKETISYESDALDEIYSLSEGCLRDALSILDQTSKTEEKLTLNALLSSYNIISNNTIKELLDSVINNDVNQLILKIEEFENAGMNAQKLIKKIINYLEKIAVDIKLNKNSVYSFKMIDTLIKSLNDCYIDARINENVFTMIKLSFLELINESSQNKVKNTFSASATIKKDVTSVKSQDKITVDDSEKQEEKQLTLPEIRINNCFVGANKEALNNIIEIWNNLDTCISSINIQDYKPVAASLEYAIFVTEESSLADLFNIKHIDIEQILNKKDLSIKLVALTEESWIKEKGKYIKKISNGKKYNYIGEPVPKDEGAAIKGQLENLFTEQVVEIS